MQTLPLLIMLQILKKMSFLIFSETMQKKNFITYMNTTTPQKKNWPTMPYKYPVPVRNSTDNGYPTA